MSPSLYIEIYNAHTPEALSQVLYAHAGAVTRAATRLRKLFPAWMEAADPHWRRYKQLVEHWVRDTLTTEDWQHLGACLGTDARTVFQRLVPPPEAPQWSLTGWVLTAMTTDPAEPFSEASRQIAQRLLRERLGQTLRPRFCATCGRLFEPDRLTQHYCSARCRNLMQQRLFRARRKPMLASDQQTGRADAGALGHARG